jgi:hypothetical protein
MKGEKEISIIAIAILLSAIAVQIPSLDLNSISSGGSGVAQASPGIRGPASNTVRLKVTRSPAAQLIEMTTGASEVWTGLMRPTDVEEMTNQGKIVSSRGGLQYCRIVMNYRRHPLDDVNFRHALFHLVPKDSLIGSLFQYIVVKVDTPVPPAQALWYNPAVDPHAYSPAEAETILTAAGYQKVGGVWKDKDGSGLPNLYLYSPLQVVSPSSYSICTRIMAEAQGIGLNNIVVAPTDFATYVDLMYNYWDFDMAWICHSVDRFPTHLYTQFSSEQNYLGSNNPHGINYPELDAKLSILWRSLGYSATVQAARDAQVLLMGGTAADPLGYNIQPTDPKYQALPTIPVYSKNHYDVEQPYIRGAINMFGYGIDNGWTLMNIYKTEAGVPGDIGTVVYIEQEYPERLNPLWALTEYGWDYMENSFDSLMTINPYTHRDEPWLATSWSYAAVSGGMDVTFDLRLTDLHGQPVKWQDGKSVSINDVKFSWDFLYGYQLPISWPCMQFYDPYNTVIVDSDTIRARMTTVSPWLVYYLSSYAYRAPPQVWTVDPRDGYAWTGLAEIINFDPSALAYPTPYNTAPGPIALPTQVFGTGPFILQHSTNFVGINGYGDLNANRNYWMETTDIDGFIENMFWRAGDAVDNDKIDTNDMAFIADWYGEMVPPAPPEADITGDGVVDIMDLATAGKYFGEGETVLDAGFGDGGGPPAPTPVFYIDPPLVTNVFANNVFSVNIEISDAVDLHIWETYLYYDEDVLSVVSITEGDFMSSAGSAYFMTKEIELGRYLLACYLTDGYAASGSGTLATVTFQVRKEGKSPIELRNTASLYDLSHDGIGRTTQDGFYQTYAAKVWVEPETIVGSSLQAGETFTVDVMVADVHDLYVWQAGITFNATVCEALSISEGEFLTRAGVTTLWTPGTIDNVNGEISYSACSLTGPTAGVTGSGQLMNVTFEVKTAGSANLNLTDVLLLDSSLTSITPLKIMWETHAQILNVGFKVGEAVRYFYVNQFTATYVDWTTVGASPYLSVPGDGNYIEGDNHCEMMGAFGFQDIRLGPYNRIKEVTLEGYTQAASTDIDYDMYSPGASYWYGSLWGSTSYSWKTPRWETRAVSEINPSVLTQAGFNDFQVIAHYYTGDGMSHGYARLDALRLKVVMDIAEGPVEAYPTWTQPLTIGVAVKNHGTETETFEVSVYADTITIGTQTAELAANAQADLEFDWSLGSVPEGLYMIRATARVTVGDTDTPDCLYLASTVKVKHPGDANDDSFVNAYDLGILAKAWETQPGDALFDPRADFNGDLIIDTQDHDIIKAYWP